MKQNIESTQIVKEFEAAREAVYSGEILGSEDFQILKEHIGGGASRKGGYSPDYWAALGFLMGKRSQEKEIAIFDASELDPKSLDPEDQETMQLYCDMLTEGIYRAKNKQITLEPYRTKLRELIGCTEKSGGDFLVSGFLIGCEMMADLLQKLDDLEAETKGVSDNAQK